MGRKQNRGYKKGAPFRDYRKFVIIAEGEREDAYFLQFNSISSRIEIIIVERDGGKSAVKYFLERAETYSKKHGLLKDDYLWFVLDVDCWPREQINDLSIACNQNNNWQIAISNPCFEVWLYYHFKNKIPDEINTCKKLKNAISKFDIGGYNPKLFANQIATASKFAKANDKHKDNNYPDINVTKLYKLAEEMLIVLGKGWSL